MQRLPWWMTHTMCEMLIDHVDGSCPVTLKDPNRYNSVRGCINRGFIYMDPHHGSRPHHTHITKAGREMLAKVLAYYADSLMAAERKRDGVLVSHDLERDTAVESFPPQ